jgi:hypothetical protein
MNEHGHPEQVLTLEEARALKTEASQRYEDLLARRAYWAVTICRSVKRQIEQGTTGPDIVKEGRSSFAAFLRADEDYEDALSYLARCEYRVGVLSSFDDEGHREHEAERVVDREYNSKAQQPGAPI